MREKRSSGETSGVGIAGLPMPSLANIAGESGALVKGRPGDQRGASADSTLNRGLQHRVVSGPIVKGIAARGADLESAGRATLLHHGHAIPENQKTL